MICNGMPFFPNDFMFQTHEDNHPPSTSSNLPPDFHGVSISPMLLRRSMSFSGVEMNGDIDEMSDDGSQQIGLIGEKKKRLSLEQVRTLEKSFELGNKLEPERKLQLARALGLQPRQIAIWFQNRRARWKTKQLERDYDHLKRQFDKLKNDNDTLVAHNKKLHAELLDLKSRESNGSGPINLNKQTKISWSNVSDNSCDVNLGATRTQAIDTPLYSHLTTKHIFTPQVGPTSPTQLLQSSSSSSRSDFQFRKINQTVPDESFSNLLSGIDDQPGFWAWPDQQQFH